MTSDRTFERIDSLFDVQQFAPVKVLIAGCGSGGGSVALQSVMSGIRNFTLIDRDTIGPENVIRHVCGRRFIGKKKVDALAEVLWDRNPNAKIERIEADIMTFPDMEKLVAGTDVVVLATDNEPSRYSVNELCVRHEKPFVVGRVFTRESAAKYSATGRNLAAAWPAWSLFCNVPNSARAYARSTWFPKKSGKKSTAWRYRRSKIRRDWRSTSLLLLRFIPALSSTRSRDNSQNHRST